MAKWKPDIFEYLDYREYLAAYYTAAKENTRAWSYRYFSRKAGYSSPNFLKLVIDGKRNLSAESVGRFSKALKLTKTESRFFADLVEFTQAETADDKNAAFEQISASRRFRQARPIDKQYYEYFSRWYYPAVREMAAREDFEEDPKWIAAQLIPPIKPKQAAECLTTLLELGLLVRGEDGRLGRGDPTLTTGHEVLGLAVGNFHREMLQKAGASIELVDRELRDLSAVTVCVSPETVVELKNRIHAFHEVLMNLCDADESPSEVYQLGIQLFPLSLSDVD